MHGLTERQALILVDLMLYQERHGMMPSIRELADRYDVSLRGVTFHLDALERKGYLDRSTSPRDIRVLKNAAGEPVRLVCRYEVKI